MRPPLQHPDRPEDRGVDDGFVVGQVFGQHPLQGRRPLTGSRCGEYLFGPADTEGRIEGNHAVGELTDGSPQHRRRTRPQSKTDEHTVFVRAQIVEGGGGPGDHGLAPRADEQVHTAVRCHPEEPSRSNRARPAAFHQRRKPSIGPMLLIHRDHRL